MGYGLIGSGKIKVAPYDPAVPFEKRNFRDIRNSSKLDYTFSDDKQDMPDYRSEAGGNLDSNSRINGVTLNIEMLEFTAENIAMILWGDLIAQTATPITGEEHIIRPGAFIPANRIIDTTVAPVLKKGSTTLDENDYVTTPGGWTIASTISTVGVTSGDTITADYTPKASTSIQALMNTAPEISIFFEGFNRNTGEYRVARIWRVKLGPASNLANIALQYANSPLTCELVKDETIVGEGLSPWFELEEPLTV
jgi:hypothetical protein